MFVTQCTQRLLIPEKTPRHPMYRDFDSHMGSLHFHAFPKCSNINALVAFLRSSAWMTEVQGIGNVVVCPVRESGGRSRLPFASHIGRREGRHPRTSPHGERPARGYRTGDLNQRLRCLASVDGKLTIGCGRRMSRSSPARARERQTIRKILGLRHSSRQRAGRTGTQRKGLLNIANE